MLRWLTTGRRFRSSSRNEVFVGASRPLLIAITSYREHLDAGRCVAHLKTANRRRDTSCRRCTRDRGTAARRRSAVGRAACRGPSAGRSRARADRVRFQPGVRDVRDVIRVTRDSTVTTVIVAVTFVFLAARLSDVIRSVRV